MLGTLRQYSGSWTVKIILGLIGLSFIIGFGMLSGYGSGTAVDGAIVAFVNDKPITNRELAIAHARLLNNYQRQLGDQLTQDLLEQLNLRFQALNVLINRIVLLEIAQTMGFVVGDEELRAAIAAVPAFQDAAGNFNAETYRYVLRSQRPAMTPADFETQQRQQMLLDKLEAFVKSQVHLSEEQILREWLLDNQQLNLEFVRFVPRVFEPRVRISEDELMAYYNERREEFTAGERVVLEVVRLDPQVLAANIAVGDDEIAARYEANPDAYRAEAQVNARHILVKVAESADAKAVDAARTKAEELLDLLAAGEDFAAVAAAHSDDPGSKRNGGALGWFGRGQMVPEFERAAFATAAGEITGPIRTQFGFHIIEVLDRRDAGPQPLDAVREQIATELRNERAAARAETLAETLAAASDLTAAATSEGLSSERVELDAEDPALRLRFSSELVDAVFGTAGKLGSTPQVFAMPGGGKLVARVVERKPAAPRPFAEVRDQIRARMIEDRAITLAAEAAAAALDEVRNGASLARIAERYGLDAIETGMFSPRSGEVPGLGRQPEVLAAALNLSKQQPTPRSTFRVGNDYVVLRLVDRIEPTPEQYHAEREQVAARLLEERREEIWQQFMRNARNQARIELENPPADLFPQEAPQS